MKTSADLVIRALLIALAFAFLGTMVNQAADDRLPWIFTPSRQVIVAGVTVPLINEREAFRFLNDPGTVFIDSRGCPEYARSHVRGAICMPPDDMEDRFPSVEPLIPPDNRIILYCYGPQCDMAEKVGAFLAQLGYRNLLIMSSGFPAWLKAKYPVDGRTERDTATDDPDDLFIEEELADQVIAFHCICKCLDPFGAKTRA